MTDHIASLRRALAARFADAPEAGPPPAGAEALTAMAGRGSCRDFAGRPVDGGLVRLLCAIALSAPTKSDLQQRDIVIVDDPTVRSRLNDLVGGDDWVARAPVMLVFCGNNRRQRLIHRWRGRPFVNDHLDAFFNAAVDAGIALQAFVTAAEAVGLGCCPLSAARNRAQEVSDLLGLPDHVFPVAGLVCGWPARPPQISPRLPLALTVHVDRFGPDPAEGEIAAYDRARAAVQPYARQRYTEDYGEAADYGWSEDKARQYSKPERADFGAFVRRKGFKLE
jgi:nitroreductase